MVKTKDAIGLDEASILIDRPNKSLCRLMSVDELKYQYWFPVLFIFMNMVMYTDPRPNWQAMQSMNFSDFDGG